VGLLRLLVVVINALGFVAMDLTGLVTLGARQAGIVVLGLAFAYAVVALLYRPQDRFEPLTVSLVHVGLDAVFVAAWLAVTGGAASPFFVLWYALIAAIGYRFDLTAVGALVACVGLDGIVIWLGGGLGEVSWVALSLRMAYMPVMGALVGFFADGYNRQLVQRQAADAELDRAKRRAREALSEFDRRAGQVLAQVPERLAIVDPTGRVQFDNADEHPVDVPGLSEERARGEHDRALGRLDDCDETIEYVVERPSQPSIWCRMAPIEDGNETVGAVLAARELPDGAL
jgi:hypothetical protein